MKWTALYAQKNIALHSLAKMAGTTTDELCAPYEGVKLENGLDKGEMFKHALSASYNAKEVIYIYTACNLPHHRDKRTPVQYATDLIIGWLSEDAILKTLNNNGKKAQPIGADKDRNFLQPDNITHIADIQIENKPVELVFDYTNHWVTHNKLDLRDNKKEHLQQHGITLLGVSPRTGQAFTLKPTQLTEFTYGEILAYRKKGWTLQGIKQHLEPLSKAIANL